MRGVGQGRGVRDVRTFEHRLVSAEGQLCGVSGVGDVGHGRIRAGDQVLKVAASGVLDGDFEFASVFVDVVFRRVDGHGASGFTSRNGDHGTVAQGHGDRSAGRISQARGVNDRPPLVDVAGGSQRQGGGVDGVGHAGADRGFIGDQVFVVAATDVGDRITHRRVAAQHIIRDHGVDGAAAGADRYGDGLTVGQRHDHRRAGDRCADRGGVHHGAAFSHGACGGQRDGRRVEGVGDAGHRCGRVLDQVFEVAAGGVLDGRFDFACVFVDVIGRRLDGHGAAGGAGCNGDDGAVAQGDGDRRAGRVGQVGGVDD